LNDAVVSAAIAVIESESATSIEKIEMLIEMAMSLQKQSKDPQQLQQAITLYQHAIELCTDQQPLLYARALAGVGTALCSIPAEGADLLVQAKSCYATALPLLQEHAAPEEVAEAEMNLGVVLQSLVAFNLARMADVIQAYQ
jgi:tetratricopeptide (TPR) repeat protein